jgi:hypothetical protein
VLYTQQILWDWLKAEWRHDRAKGDAGESVPNREAMRARRFSRGFEQLGRSRRQRVTNAQRRADHREHARKWRQEKRRARRAELEAAA